MCKIVLKWEYCFLKPEDQLVDAYCSPSSLSKSSSPCSIYFGWVLKIEPHWFRGLSKSKDLDGRIVQNTNEADSAYEYSFQQLEAVSGYVFDINTI